MSDFRLRVFSSVAKNLSFTKASQELFISQPAITKHIQELETMYQTRLFERMGNKILLTDAGRLLLEHCEKILEDYGRLEYEMNLLRNEHTGELRLGASTTIAQYVLPPLLARFIEKFPQVSLSLFSGNSSEVEKALQEHRIDLALVEGNTRQPNLKYTPFLQDELEPYREFEIKGIASSGAKGKKMIMELHPDLLFLDVELPDILGLNLLSEIKDDVLWDMKVVFYTSYDKYLLQALR